MADTQKASSSKEEVLGVFRVGVYELNMGIAVGTFLKITMGHKHHGLDMWIFFSLMGMFWCPYMSLLDQKNERFSWKWKCTRWAPQTDSYGAPVNGLLDGYLLYLLGL